MNQLLTLNEFVVNEKIKIISNEYPLYDEKGNQVGFIKEKRSFFTFIMSRFFAPTTLRLYDENNRLVASMYKGWAFLHPSFDIYDDKDMLIATIRNKFTLFKPKSTFFNSNGDENAYLTGNIIAWNFNITDTKGNEIATVDKQWKGFVAEIFTTADKYHVSISPRVTDPSLRTALIMVSGCIDLIYKENSN